MSITSVHTDYEQLTVTILASFDASIEQVWELWSDPRKLERWWGPPGLPATFEQHDLVAGAEVRYVMTGPDGDRYRGVWRVTAVDPPDSLEFTDAAADAAGRPTAEMPVSRVSVRLTGRERGTDMELRTRFESREDLERWLGTGTREGQQAAIGQMDAVLGARSDDRVRVTSEEPAEARRP